MKIPQFVRSMSPAALFTMTVFLAVSGWMIWAADSFAPSSLVGQRYALTDSTGSVATMFFSSNNRYFLDQPTQGTNEAGFFSASLSGNTWNVVTTREDGRVTTQYALNFTAGGVGEAIAAQAGRTRTTNTFQEATIPAAGLASLSIQNDASIFGPAFFTINFSGGTSGSFKIDRPGYGAGTFIFTPGTNTAKLFLTYTNADLLGDADDFTLEFRAPSGSATPSHHSGTNRVSGVSYPVTGSFTYKSL